MIPKMWSWFTLLVVVPAIGFFLFASHELGSSRETENKIAGIIDNRLRGDESSTSALAQAENLASTLQRVNSEFSGTSYDSALQNAETLAESISDLRMFYAGIDSSLADDGRPVGAIAREATDIGEFQSLSRTITELNQELAALRRFQAVVETDDHSYDVYFAFDSNELLLPVRHALLGIAEREAALGNTTLTIISYADRRGDLSPNCDLAKRRAQAILGALETLPVGIETRSIPRGENGVPIAPAEDGRQEPANRVARLRFGTSYAPLLDDPCGTAPAL